jgi:tRNA pseudouridine32 synthase/23S rRNA pseudouridine746 synthase
MRPDADTLLAVLHADEALLVLVKPSGLLAVPGRGEDKQDCLSRRAQVQWPDALVVHRLDMSTSGLVVMARGLEAQRALSRAFEQRRVHKRYMAVVAGQLANPLPDNGWNTIDLPLAVDWVNRPRSKVCLETGKPSLTRWRLAEPQTPNGYTGIGTRVELEPVTGRTHQLRVHLQASGHPIVGDALYATPDQQALSKRLLLHADMLELPHPVTGQMLRFHSPCPF